MQRFLFSCVLIFFTWHQSIGQSSGTTSYSLTDIINISRQNSISARQAETTKENRYWQFQTYRSNYKPQLQLEGTFPGFSRTVDEVRQQDGSYRFLPVNINNSDLSLNLRQSIGRTNTTVFVNTQIYRFDNFDGNDQTNFNQYHLYGGNPVEIGFLQPLFQYNDLKWDKKIEPLRYEESQREFLEDLEEISMFAVRRFFDLMLAQVTLEISLKNLANNDTIYKIAQGRYNLGTVTENELLQLQLTLINSKQSVSQSRLDLETYSLRLRTFTGLTDLNRIELVLPQKAPEFMVDENTALKYAHENRPQSIEFERRRLEGDRNIARAKGETGLNADLFGRFGLTNNTALNAPPGDIFKEPENQFIVNMGFSIPVLDWGRRKSRVKTAEANQKLIQYTVNQDQLNFEEEILTQVRQFEMLKEAVDITRLADDIAQRRYNVSKNRYLIGKIAITDLNIALQEKDDAKRRYIQALESIWLAYYNLRLLTLYDFEIDQKIEYAE